MTTTTSTGNLQSRANALEWGRRVGWAAVLLLLAFVAHWLHAPLYDSCEPDCSPEYLLHSNLRLQALELFVYANGLLLPLLAIVAGTTMLWRPLRNRQILLVLVALMFVILVDSWLMRYW